MAVECVFPVQGPETQLDSILLLQTVKQGNFTHHPLHISLILEQIRWNTD